MKLKPFQLERFFARYEFDTQYLLCGSDCESTTVGELLHLEPEAGPQLQKLWLGYTEAPGSPKLRKEISQLYSSIVPDEILVHAGAEEAIFNFMNAVLNPGDHVIVHFPGYQSLFEVASAAGCEVTRWETLEEENWELDLAVLEKSLRPNTRLIIFNCPHNPTGYLMKPEKQRALLELARAYNLMVFSDEVYRFLEHAPGTTLPAACDLYENAVSLGVMSKSFGLAGLRIGWIATRNRQIYKAMASFKDYTSICNSAPSEFLAALALRHREAIIERNRNIVLENLKLLNPFFEKYSHLFLWNEPHAGAVAFPSIRKEHMKKTVEEFCVDLVKKKSVLLLPGNYFEAGDHNFRIGFGRKNLPESLEKLEEYLAETF